MRIISASWCVSALIVCLMCGGSTAVWADGRLDDSTSPRDRVQAVQVLSEYGLPLENDLDARFAVMSFGRVDYRLATSAYLGQQAEIYFVVPPFVKGLLSPAALVVSWFADDGFADGTAHAGERVLVWRGVVDKAWMSTSLDLTVQVELGQLRLSENEPFGLEAYFEIEVLP